MAEQGAVNSKVASSSLARSAKAIRFRREILQCKTIALWAIAGSSPASVAKIKNTEWWNWQTQWCKTLFDFIGVA